MPGSSVDAEVLQEREAEFATFDAEARCREALVVIDEALARMIGRELVTRGEIVDVLLDIRGLLTPSA